MHQVQYTAPRSPTNSPVFVHKELDNCTHVFVRKDSKKPPLHPTCEGPFRVVDRGMRHFVITRGNN